MWALINWNQVTKNLSKIIAAIIDWVKLLEFAQIMSSYMGWINLAKFGDSAFPDGPRLCGCCQ